ncbi:MAG: hypothetical protein GAK28_00814 [Luteibacter sp.]|nr:hypothetical protein [Luteibacter sp.]KAF1009181.1 MAG: hypothetical protein GAK28_00814 [Luteibacter sp.]
MTQQPPRVRIAQAPSAWKRADIVVKLTVVAAALYMLLHWAFQAS